MNRTEKQAKIDQLKEKFANAQSVVLVDFTGVTVEKITQVRSKLRKAGVHYEVIKNTLAKKAMPGTPVESLAGYYEGITGTAISFDDPAAPAKVLTEVVKEVDAIKFKAAMVGGQAFGPEAVPELAKLPSKKDIQAQLLATIQAPVTHIVAGINAPLRDFVFAIDAIRRSREEQSGETA